MAQLTFVGTGEAFDPALPNTSLLYRGSQTLLVDCGFSVPHALWRISEDPSLIDAIYISHIHADHSFGLPALLLWMRIFGRKKPLRVIGGPGTPRWLTKLLELGYPACYEPGKCFDIVAEELAPGEQIVLGEATLRNAESEHGVRNLSLRVDEGGRGFAYSGDGRPTPATRELFAGVDLLVHECYALDLDIEGHANFSTLVALGQSARVKRLALLHLGTPEKEAIRAAARDEQSELTLLVPAPGDVMTL
ncbi:MAG: MBL fold metallo-hydrolase [Polyangiaceae bacterium]